MKNSKLPSQLFLRSSRTDLRWVWLAIILSLLILGFIIRLVVITEDSFDFDEYACMLKVDQSFSTYVKDNLFAFPHLVYYWLSYRLFGNSLIAYRTMSLIASISFLLLTILCLRRFWPSEKVLWLVILLIMIFNRNALYLTRYAMFGYGWSLLVSAGLFFLFLRLAEGPIEKKKWRWISACFLPAAFFTKFTTIVPLATGILLVIVFRWWRFVSSRTLTTLWRWLWELKSFLIFPLIYSLMYFFGPVLNLGADKRPDMAPLFFTTSGYSYDFLGVMKFILTNTYSLFGTMLIPLMRDRFTLAAMLSWGFLAVLTVVQAARRRADRRTLFALFFLLTTLVSILCASLLGLYPYGNTRYTPYLLVPTAILIGYGGFLVYRCIFRRLELTRSVKALLTFSALVVFIAGGYMSVERYNSFAITRENNYQAINWLRTKKPDLILSDAYMMPILSARAPAVYERAHSMGWRTIWGENYVFPELVDVIKGVRQPQSVASILVILRHEDIARDFPRWNTLLRNYFSLDTFIKAPYIWVGLYWRKVQDST